MIDSDLSPDTIERVACPRCYAKPGQECIPGMAPHRERREAAVAAHWYGVAVLDLARRAHDDADALLRYLASVYEREVQAR